MVPRYCRDAVRQGDGSPILPPIRPAPVQGKHGAEESRGPHESARPRQAFDKPAAVALVIVRERASEATAAAPQS
jgi:hypothetical protein